MADDPLHKTALESVLTQEQDALLDLYLNNLDNFFENQKNAEKIQVEIETLHLKKILSE
ncbi:hypothetical protein ACFSC6_20550 [Rufibacter sediminis]|uniref:Uncharacterized protein n=1 Tax=Rufibacter sediminis TaxID=2762756 RepID=A0ABR6VNU9_9BACT|nr:hypothetical protein [Rufibacter sediminis]MBC3538842.1 hypothetical protein [Rufibacter sediminis]